MKKIFDIIYEGEEFIIVNKSAEILSIPDRFDSSKLNLYHELKKKYGEIFIVHRLDAATSGLICFARTEAAHRHLSQQFEERKIKKTYLAIVQGNLVQDSGEIDAPIAKHSALAGKMLVHKRGKDSLTLFKVLERFKHYSLVEVDLKTGRTHQIRVHFASIGHSLAVDSLYSRKEAFYLSEVKQKSYRLGKMKEERPLMSRLSLHAYQLSLENPTTAEIQHFEVEPPKDFRAVLQQLRKWGK